MKFLKFSAFIAGLLAIIFGVETSSARTISTEGDVIYETEDETSMNVTVSIKNTSQFRGAVVDITIPPTVIDISINRVTDQPYTVVGIASGAFQDCTGLRKVTITAPLTAIPSSTFKGCAGITEVILPSTLQTIGDNTFQGCANMTSVSGHSTNLTSIGEYAFNGCSSLLSFDFPNSLTEIKKYAFAECTSLTKIDLPGSIGEVTEAAFYYCTSLTEANLRDGITKINKFAFQDCKALKCPDFPASLESIEYRAFNRCYALGDVKFPHSISLKSEPFSYSTIASIEFAPNPAKINIGSSAFQGVNGLTTVTIPGSITEIGDATFMECPDLQSVTLLEGIETIGEGAFRECPSLTKVVLPESLSTIKLRAFYEDKLLAQINLPSKLKNINYEAFYYCESIKELSLPGGITIGKDAFRLNKIETLICPNAPLGKDFSEDAFNGLPELKAVTLPGGMDSIPAYLIYNAPKLEHVAIGDGITKIGKCAFKDCTALKSVEIPGSVKTIGYGAFLSDKSLASVYFNEGLEEIGSSAFEGTALTEVTFPSTLRRIGTSKSASWNFHYGAFYNTPLATVNFNEGLEEINDCSFEECTNLTVIKLPESLVRLGNHAFADCSSLTQINLPANLQYAGEKGFSFCSKLKHIELPAGCTFGSEVFRYSGLNSITWPNEACIFSGNKHFENTQFEVLTLPDWLEEINEYMFHQCYPLTTLNLPANIKRIGYQAFEDDSKLMNVKFPASMELLGERSFQNCPLGELTLPADAMIERFAFYGSSLTSLTFPETPCYFTYGTFQCEKTLTTLTLPSWMETVPEQFFQRAASLETIIYNVPDPLPEDGKYLTTIGSQAFGYCSHLHDLTIPSTVNLIEEKAFEYCGTDNDYKFGTLTLTDGLTIGNYAFQGCKIQKLIFKGCSEFKTGVFNSVTTIDEIEFPECMTTIPNGFCSDWTALTKVVFPNTVTKIGKAAFSGCTGLKSITLPENLVEIGDEGFMNSGLESIVFPDNDVKLGTDCFRYWYGGDRHLKSVEFSWKQSNIGTRCFYQQFELENVTWRKPPEGETAPDLTIGEEAFNSCSKITSVNLPDANVKLGNQAFAYCNGITSIKWPSEDKTVAIGSNSFNSCRGLTELVTPPLTTEIGSNAFEGCSSLTDVIINAPGPQTIGQKAFYDVPIKNLTLNEGLKTISTWGFSGTKIETLRIPSTLTDYQYGFTSCKSLKSITFADNYQGTQIPSSAFSDCSALETVDFAPSITNISSSAFKNCTSLKELVFPPALTTISNSAYSGCTGIEHLVIPKTVTFLGDYTFAGCTGLLDVVNNASKLSMSDNATFKGCTKLETFTSNGYIPIIGYNCFEDCTSLKHFINNSEKPVHQILQQAFQGCSALEEADFFKKVKLCGYSVFKNCTSLRQFTMSDSIYITPSTILNGCDHLESIVWPDNPDHKFGMKADQIAEAPLRALSYSYVTDIVAPTSVSNKSSMDAYVGKNGYSFNLTNPKISKLMVPRGEKWKYHEKGYGELFDIVEMADPKVELTGDIFSNYDEEKNVNNYIAYLRWHLPLSDLNPNDSTKVEVFRDGKRIAEILFSKPSEPHYDPRWECDSVVTVQVTYNGSQLKAFRGQFIGLDDTGEYWRKEYCLQDSLELVFDAKTSKRQLAFDRYGYKSWFAFADYFDSPKLTEKNVPTSYTYSVKMRGYRYMTLENNPGLEEKDGKLYKEVWHEPKEFDCPEVKLYTVNAFPTLQFNGLYSESDVMEDIARIKDVSSTDNMKGGYRISYKLDTESLMQKGYDAEKENDKEYFIKSVELRQYKDGKYVPVAEYILPSGKDDGAKRRLTGEFDIADGFTVEPGNTYITITHSTGFRNDFGSGPITIPNVPILENIDISHSNTSHFDEDATFHVNNGKIPTKFTYKMRAKLSGLGYVDSIPSKGNYHVGIWRSFGNVPSEQASYYCQERGGYRASDVFAEELRLHPADPKGEASVHSFCSDCHEDTQSTLSEDKVLVSSDVVDVPLGTSVGSYTNRLYVKVPKSYLPNQDSWMIAESTIEPQPVIISGVEDVNIDNPNGLEDGEERLFDLQGRPLPAPVPGQPFIRVTRTGSSLLLP